MVTTRKVKRSVPHFRTNLDKVIDGKEYVFLESYASRSQADSVAKQKRKQYGGARVLKMAKGWSPSCRWGVYILGRA